MGGRVEVGVVLVDEVSDEQVRAVDAVTTRLRRDLETIEN